MNSIQILKETATQLLIPLTIIFNKSLQEDVVPEDWRVANIILIFKKGNLSNPTNYHPVSLTSIVSKILESINPLRINHQAFVNYN